MANLTHVELITPERVLFSGEAEAVVLRADGADTTFLANHLDYIAAVDICVLRFEGDIAEAVNAKRTPGKWHGIRLEWDALSDRGRNHGRTYIDGTLQPEHLALNHSSVNGISSVHLLSVAERTDDRGFLVESVSAEAK